MQLLPRLPCFGSIGRIPTQPPRSLASPTGAVDPGLEAPRDLLIGLRENVGPLRPAHHHRDGATVHDADGRATGHAAAEAAEDAADEGKAHAEAWHATCSVANQPSDGRTTKGTQRGSEEGNGVDEHGRDDINQVTHGRQRVGGLGTVAEAEATNGDLHIDVRGDPLQDVSDAPDDALQDTSDDLRRDVALLLSIPTDFLCKLLNGSDHCDDERAHTDGTKCCGARNFQAATHALLLSEIPAAENSAIGGMANIEDHVCAPKVHKRLDKVLGICHNFAGRLLRCSRHRHGLPVGVGVNAQTSRRADETPDDAGERATERDAEHGPMPRDDVGDGVHDFDGERDEVPVAPAHADHATTSTADQDSADQQRDGTHEGEKHSDDEDADDDHAARHAVDTDIGRGFRLNRGELHKAHGHEHRDEGSQ
mmetsp:Transcript_139271/g.445213  ORF Transcript_139271/g.445213 Transcript_139271/m.445213 type:complete len:423 (-) Transcript_139271:1509-2777(-)